MSESLNPTGRWFPRAQTPQSEPCGEGCGSHSLRCENCGRRIWHGKNSNYGLVSCEGNWCYDCNPFARWELPFPGEPS